MKTNTAHLTIENITRLAELIAAAHSIPMADAMDLAEFNLRFAESYAQAASRI